MRPESARGLASGLILALCVALPALAQQPLADHPGYLDYSQFGPFSEDQLEIHIGIQEPALRLVAAATRSSDPDLSDMLGGLRQIEVWVHNLDDDSRRTFQKKVDQIAEVLESKSWVPAMTLRGRGTRGHMYLRLDGDRPQGLVATFISDEDQAIFVNIVGEIDPSQIGRLAAKFNLGMLEEAAKESAKPDAEAPDAQR